MSFLSWHIGRRTQTGRLPYDNVTMSDTTHKKHAPHWRQLRSMVNINSDGKVQLDLAEHNLDHIPPQVFTFVRLQILKLSNNAIRLLPDAVSGLYNLRLLNANHNRIDILPDTIGNCTHLERLELSHNRLKIVPLQLSNLTKLKVLNLGHNQLDNLPHALGDLINLRTLILENNKIWYLPFSMQNMQHLTLLNLSNNNLDQYPVLLCGLYTLEVLNLKNNKLRTLPNELAKLLRISDLNVSMNQLEKLPPCIPFMRGIEHLDLSRNKIKKLSKKLSRLPKLSTLQLQGNNIAIIPNDLPTVEYLNCSDNKMKVLSVARMKYLKHLNANRNFLETLPAGLCNLHHLESLKLNSNKISYITQDVGLLTTLKVLDLGNNKLARLPHSLHDLSNIETLNLTGNKFESKRHMSLQRYQGLSHEGQAPKVSPVSQRKATTRQQSIRKVSIPWHMKQSKSKLVSRNHGRRHNADFTQELRMEPVEADIPDETPQRFIRNNGLRRSKSYVENWVDERLRDDPASGDGTDRHPGRARRKSGPQTDADFQLLGLCSDVQTMLGKQVLQPVLSHKDVRARPDSAKVHSGSDYYSMTSPTTGQQLTSSGQPLTSGISPLSDTCISDAGHAHVPHHIKLNSGIQRSHTETFRVNQEGGLFKFSKDTNISIYFPKGTLQRTLTVSMYMEHIPSASVEKAKQQRPLVDNLLAIGDIVKVQINSEAEFKHHVSLTIPLPKMTTSGRLHVLTFWEDNTCSPSPQFYTMQGNYLTLKCSHFSGKGVVVTKSKCQYKACKSVEALLQELFV